MTAKHRFFSYALVAALVVASLGWLLWGRPTASDDALVVYTTRQEFLLEPVIEAFRKRHDVDVTVVYSKKGLVERLKLEGRNSPADVIIAADASIMMPLQEAGVLSPLPHNIVALVEKSYRSDNLLGRRYQKNACAHRPQGRDCFLLSGFGIACFCRKIMLSVRQTSL